MLKSEGVRLTRRRRGLDDGGKGEERKEGRKEERPEKAIMIADGGQDALLPRVHKRDKLKKETKERKGKNNNGIASQHPKRA
jgi:hypothetical protein